MRGRGQLLSALVVVALVVVGGVALQRSVGPNPLPGPASPAAPSGAWFCPHGGGRDWETTLEVANPGTRDVEVRVTALSDARPSKPATFTVDAGSAVRLPLASSTRSSSSVVEYFGGWVAVGWVARAGGGEQGVAAEPCAPAAGRTWLLPDGSTQLAEGATTARRQKTQDSYVVVMNPFASDAVFSIGLYTDKEAPVRPGAWTNVRLKPFRSRTFSLNEQRLGFATVSATVEAKVGRIVASNLDVNQLGGVRAALGQRRPTPPDAVLPGAFDQGRTELVVMDPTAAPAQVTGTVLGRSEPAPIGGADGEQVTPNSAQTFPLTTDGPASLDVRVPAGSAVVRRTFGRTTDQAATGPAVASSAWVILPAVAGSPSHPGIAVSNPGPEPVELTLRFLSSGDASGDRALPEPITMQVGGLRSAGVPQAFVDARPMGAVVATSTNGTFVPAAASYSLGREGYAGYAVALGIAIPSAWVPSRP
jgi:hypothetical protein